MHSKVMYYMRYRPQAWGEQPKIGCTSEKAHMPTPWGSFRESCQKVLQVHDNQRENFDYIKVVDFVCLRL